MNTDDLDRNWGLAVAAVASDLIIERWRIEEALAYGGCAALALALGENLGLPIFIAASENNYLHAFCAVGADRGLDIWGVRPFRTIRSVWAEDDPDVQLLQISAADLRSMGGIRMEPTYEQVPGMLVREFARRILKEHEADDAQRLRRAMM